MPTRRAPRGADYGLQSEQSQIVVVRAAAGAAYAFSPRLWAGATVGLVYNENTLVAPFHSSRRIRN